MAIFRRLKTFLLEARQEFRHVNWPTRQEATRLTTVVIVLSVALALFLGGFDYLFSFVIKSFVLKI